MMRFVAMLVLTAGLLVGLAGESMAQGAASLPDIVETTDGTVVRGTIVERRPDGSVIMEDYFGEVREFEAEDVVYAGAAVREASGGASSGMVVVQFAPDSPHLRLHRRMGTGRTTGHNMSTGQTYVRRVVLEEEVCRGPCEAQIPVGPATLNVRTAAGWPLLETTPTRFDLGVDSEIAVSTQRRGTLRAVLVGAGMVMVAGGAFLALSGDESGSDPMVISGWVLGGVGALAFLGGPFLPNTARLSVSPLER